MAPAPVEHYITRHSELEMDKGSRAWTELPEDERAQHADEPGVFEDIDD